MEEIFFSHLRRNFAFHQHYMNILQKLFTLFSFLVFLPAYSQYIAVDDTTYTPEQLVKEIFFTNDNSSCIIVENVIANGFTFSGGEKSFGYFNRNGSTFQMDEGIILTTGNIQQSIGPNNIIISDDDPSWQGDLDLENNLNIRNTFNATSLEFDFIVTNTDRISFEYLFASEQYLLRGSPNQCNYTDGFAFLIKEAGSTAPYRNLAVIPGTDTPIRSNTVRGSGGLCNAVNEQYFAQFNPFESPINYNGETKTLTATTAVVPGVKYHIKLVIGDQGNGLYDSAVFLKAGSFIGNKNIGNNRLLEDNSALCEGSTLLLDATVANANYQWFKNGVRLVGESDSTYTVSSAGFYQVEIDASGCLLKGSVSIEYAEIPNALEKSFCNYNNGAPVTLNLQDLNTEIVSNYHNYFVFEYYDAAGILLPNNFSYNIDTTIYAQINSGDCETVSIPVHLLTPKISQTLADQVICQNATTTLEVENTFAYYKWMREDGTIITEGPNSYYVDNVPIGSYVVELTSLNNCKVQQKVIVSSKELPTITHIEVSGNSATIFVTGGESPYEYSLDGINYQNSNVFTGLNRGLQKSYVRDALQCAVVTKEFLIINLINILTPNGDGKNDLLDYSDLKIKDNVSIKIYDRMGVTVYSSSPTDFTWNGKINGRPLPTGTYWYVLSWNEPFTNVPVSYKGWILLKNRN